MAVVLTTETFWAGELGTKGSAEVLYDIHLTPYCSLPSSNVVTIKGSVVGPGLTVTAAILKR